jgi:hypothetical protein
MKKNKGGGPYDTILPPTGIYPYSVSAETTRRTRTLGEIRNIRKELAQDRTFRLPNGKLIDLNRIARDLDRSV